MSGRATADTAVFSRPRFLDGVELVSVAYRDRCFPVHAHDEYVVGTVLAGAEALRVGGRDHPVGIGDVLRLHPGEPHANRTVGSATLRYRVLYLPGRAMQPYLPDHLSSQDMRFATAVTRTPALARLVAAVHDGLADPASDALEQGSALAALVQALFADPGARAVEPRTNPATVRTREWIDRHATEAWGLDELARVAGLSVFRTAHLFKHATGLSPIAYRNQRRVMVARQMLRDGESIAGAALAVGFADQSHLTRQFQRLIGTSPGRYRQQ